MTAKKKEGVHILFSQGGDGWGWYDPKPVMAYHDGKAARKEAARRNASRIHTNRYFVKKVNYADGEG